MISTISSSRGKPYSSTADTTMLFPRYDLSPYLQRYFLPWPYSERCISVNSVMISEMCRQHVKCGQPASRFFSQGAILKSFIELPVVSILLHLPGAGAKNTFPYETIPSLGAILKLSDKSPNVIQSCSNVEIKNVLSLTHALRLFRRNSDPTEVPRQRLI